MLKTNYKKGGNIMNSYEFEVKCKDALIKILEEKYEEKFKIKDLHLVWLSKSLQNFKCVIIDLGKNQRYYECTYNGDKDELYVDIYQKEHNFAFKGNELTNAVNI